MSNLENKEFNDQNERLSLNAKIDKNLLDLEKKSDALLNLKEQQINKDALQELISESNSQEIDIDKLLLEHEDDISELKWKKIIVSKILSPNIIQKINDISENPVSRQGRQSSYLSVDSFSQDLVQNWWFFGKLVKLFS